MEEPQTETVVERTEAQLVELVKNQVEYYFSKENLQSDPFLSSQMDAQMCVPISVVMKFAKLKALTHDESILRKALVDSTAVSIVDNKIKANIKPPGRSTIILREIPSDAPVEEVKEIFNYPGAKPVSSIRSEIGDTWFVVMESEEDAKDTLLDLRLKKRTFRDVAVKGRLKTETVVRSFFPVQTSIAPVVPFPGIMGAGMPIPVVDMRAFGYMGMPVPVLAPVDGAVAEGASAEASPTAAPAAAEARSSPNKPAQNAAATTPNSGAKGGKGQGAGAGKGGDKGNNNNAEKGRRQDGGKDSGAANGRNGGKGAGKDKKEEPAPRKPSIDLNLASFPPLGAVDDTPVPTPGYKGPFLKYSGDDIIAIAKGVKEAKLPASLNPSLHPLAMTVEANKDLLKRQRTFSIDETREQLRQGRPVTRDAILPGKVDSRSLYYGDEAPAAGASTQPKKEAAPAAAPAAPVTSPSATKKGNEAAAVASDVVEQVAADAANLALSNAPPVVEAMNASTPQKITPSTWAAMLKSSASAATVVETKPAAPAPVKRTPAKEGATKTAAAGSSSSAKPGKSGEGKEKEGEGKRRKGSEGSGRGKGENAPAKEGAQGSNSSDAADPTNSNRPEKGSDTTNTTTAKSTAAAEPAAATSSWGGKASFANILKLNADAEAFTPAATSPKPPASTAAPTTATSSGNKDKEGKDDRRRGPQSSSAPAKPSASAVAAASKREPKPAPAGDNEWSTSTGKARNHNREHRDNKEPREPRGEHREGRGEGREHRERDHHHRPSAGSGSTATTGANAKGVWARETLPPAATTAAEK